MTSKDGNSLDIWLGSGMTIGIYCISIRMKKFCKDVPQLVVNTLECPPLKEKIDIDEARRNGTTQEHTTIWGLNINDLIHLRNVIDEEIKKNYV